MSVMQGGRNTRKNKSKSKSNNKIDLVSVFLNMLNTIKLYHWKTHSYATHKATDQLYDDLSSKVDEFVEVMLGKNSIVSPNDLSRGNLLGVRQLTFKTYKNNNEFKSQIENYKKILINLSSVRPFDEIDNSDLLAIRDEILALLNHFLYLLTFK
jgi:DNA-binding ferritin-like protein